MSLVAEMRALLAKATPGTLRVTRYVDAGGGRHIELLGPPTSIEAIRVSCPTAVGRDGVRSITAKQRDAVAALIVTAINALPELLDVVEAATRIYDDRAYDEAGDACDVTHERMESLGDALAKLEESP